MNVTSISAYLNVALQIKVKLSTPETMETIKSEAVQRSWADDNHNVIITSSLAFRASSSGTSLFSTFSPRHHPG